MPTQVEADLRRLWARRAEMFGDIRSTLALWHAIRDSVTLPGEGSEWVNVEVSRAVCALLYDEDAPAGIRSPATVTDERLERAGITREQLDYCVARERIAAVENGARIKNVVPRLSLGTARAGRLRRLSRRAPRARVARRRTRRTARAPDDPSRPRPSSPAAAAQRERPA